MDVEGSISASRARARRSWTWRSRFGSRVGAYWCTNGKTPMARSRSSMHFGGVPPHTRSSAMTAPVRATDQTTYTPHSDATAAETLAAWHPAALIAFRISFVYLGLYILFTQMLQGMLIIPGFGVPQIGLLAPFRALVLWVGTHILGVPPFSAELTGSGDKMFDWAQAFTLLLIALVTTAVWSALARDRTRHDSLNKWFRLYLRIALGTTMLSYGFVKAVP